MAEAATSAPAAVAAPDAAPPISPEAGSQDGPPEVDTQGSRTASPAQTRKRSRSPSQGPPSTHPTEEATTTSPEQPRKRLKAAIDEKTRTRRLFGGLLSAAPSRKRSTSDRKSSATGGPTEETLARRASIEARKRSELAKRDEEIAGAQAEKVAELNRRRRKRQVLLEERDKEREWDNRVMRAGYLRTRGELGIYWKPWKMTEDQEDEVEERRRKVEGEVEADRERWKDEKRRRNEDAERRAAEKRDVEEHEKQQRNNEEEKTNGEGSENRGGTDEMVVEKMDELSVPKHSDKKEAPSPSRREEEGHSPSEDEADNGVDAGEDTVMY
ncbi:Hypothetical protein D9617_22g065980 [Elsinoe fawcettii]|nr:Hypothetical protein D9617_22g065980 [Elsinoe fawcettii]